MPSVQEHYATHLAPIYLWMSGGVQASVARGDAELDALQLPAKTGAGAGAVALDLGAGFGVHAIPLARRGYSVIAIDSSAELLQQLQELAGSLSIHTIVGDLVGIRDYVQRSVDLVLCMGDTLTHLSSPESITALFSAVADLLGESGTFVLSFRDYSEAAAGERKFIPVKSDTDRILTCLLEYSDAYVTVHDIVHERAGASWNLKVSSYRKLRLSAPWVTASLEQCGFSVSQDVGLSGMVRMMARKLKVALSTGPARC